MNGRWVFILGGLALAISPPGPAAARAADLCLECHQTLGDAASTRFMRDVHRLKGLTCADCHGGSAAEADMDAAMDRAKGFIGVPKGNDISAVCARCHADPARMKERGSALPTNQLELLTTSAHGELSLSGKERIAQCTTCHGAHGILPASDPGSPVSPLKVVATCTRCHADAARMRSYNPGLPVDQLEKYRTSVHGVRNARGDANAAECASCHGSHGVLPVNDVRSSVYPTNLPSTCGSCHSDAARMKGYGIPTDQFEKFSGSVHGVALLTKKDPGAPSCNTCHGNHGATPPGVESISKVCGTCHALNADLFSASPHKRAFDDKGLPECGTCHGHHDIVAATQRLLGTGPEAVCSRCHTDRTLPEGLRSAAVMRALSDSLVGAEDGARALVDEAEQKGMEAGEMKFRLRDVRQARLEARTTVHAFQVERFREVVAKGLNGATEVAREARSAIDEYYFRRIGLGISTLIISIVALSLYLYIRRLERRKPNETAAHHSHHNP